MRGQRSGARLFSPTWRAIDVPSGTGRGTGCAVRGAGTFLGEDAEEAAERAEPRWGTAPNAAKALGASRGAEAGRMGADRNARATRPCMWATRNARAACCAQHAGGAAAAERERDTRRQASRASSLDVGAESCRAPTPEGNASPASPAPARLAETAVRGVENVAGSASSAEIGRWRPGDHDAMDPRHAMLVVVVGPRSSHASSP